MKTRIRLCADLAFADRALVRCNEMLTILLPSVYVRHHANTWKWSARLETSAQLIKASPPGWATSADLLTGLEEAHADMSRASFAGARRAA